MGQHSMTGCLAEAGLHGCPICGGDDIVLSPGVAFAEASVCRHLAGCTRCAGQGFVRSRDSEGYEVMAECGRAGIARRVRRFNDMHLPARYHDVRLSTWSPPPGARGEQAAAHAAVVRLRERLGAAQRADGSLDPGVRGLGLSGPPGVGKTHLLCGLASDLVVEGGLDVRYADFATLLWDLKTRYERGTGETELLAPLVQADVLLIDEVGKGKASDWELGILDALVAGRYNRRKTVVFATNFAFGEASPRQLKERTDFQRESLRDRVGDRVFSRLAEMCEWLPLDGEDLRRAATASARSSR